VRLRVCRTTFRLEQHPDHRSCGRILRLLFSEAGKLLPRIGHAGLPDVDLPEERVRVQIGRIELNGAGEMPFRLTILPDGFIHAAGQQSHRHRVGR